ncbi:MULTISPECIES: ferritin-like domain-containing protein [Calditerrivibrio]|jgi:bacterioferritin|uniref:Bacterioferritin n=1 Tax=Calditerrivibrio nitroreducens TaxID=477976 RepID=A0A2J6WM77_9BACT|nr:MAG: bacterioferritin [Calditerrivibrio nitroreducens]
MHKKSIELLNQAIAEEMTALQQYMYFHFHCDDQDLDILSNIFRQNAIQEMIHVERFAERILFLKGEVEMKASQDVQKITNPEEMLKMAIKLEEDTIVLYNKFANECAQQGDSVTKQLFESVIAEEERHYDDFDKESENIIAYGKEYLVLQSMERAKKRGIPRPTTPVE